MNLCFGMSEPRSKKARSANHKKRARVFFGHQKKQLKVPATAVIPLVASTSAPTYPLAPAQPTSTLAPALPPTPTPVPTSTPTPVPTLL